MMKLTPKGMRDTPPEAMFVREQVIDKIREIFRNYGYRPIETPALEYLKTLRAKAGDEVSKQIFVIDGNEYGLRFDLTVPLARYAASSDDPKPFKRYAIDAVWRKEEPQRGRFREFYQCDADIVGSNSMRSEAELLAMAKEICSAFGFDKPRIMLNSRKILDGIVGSLGITEKKNDVFRILDKLDKLEQKVVEGMLEEIIGKEKTKSLMEIIQQKGSNKDKLAVAAKYSKEGAEELEQIINMCDFEIEICLFLVRGLGYYTGPTYEVKLSEGIGTVIAGGRYDGLLGVYGQDSPATGISVGIERLITLIFEREKANKKTDTKVLVASISSDFYANAMKIASELRAANIPTETDLNERNLRKQFDYSNSLGIPYVIVLGKKEIESGQLTLRNMSSGKEEKLEISKIIEKLG